VARRRDGGIRQIRSNTTPTYPTVDLPTIEAPAAEQTAGDDTRRLSPALDTGIAVETRADRAAAEAERRQRITVLSVAAAIVALTTAAVGWHYASDRLAADSPIARASAAIGIPVAKNASATATSKVQTARQAATPIFGRYGKLNLHLPVPTRFLTEIGFHQASYAWALPMKTSMRDADLSEVAKSKTTGRDLSKQPSGPNAMLTGSVLRMWRNRPGKPNTAADIGAKAGTVVLSPVTGTVVRIKSYKLYGRYSDYEMHIVPDNTSGIDVVMIHLTDLSCEVGDRVEAGVSRVAKIRKFSDKFHDQLSDYTKDAGDHVHLQVYNSDYHGYTGLQGAVDPSSGVNDTGCDENVQ
jgi:murein DD-endopeptidase MepM/ murein hydrolase activator NlpD